MKKSLHRQYRYILFVGLTLWLIGDTIYLCCNSTPANDTAFGLISCDITFWTILGVTVIGAFEEYVFRGWTTRYKKAILWSLIFQTVYCLFTAGWLIGAAVGILSVCIFFILKQTRHKRLLLIVSTSMFFALAHAGRFYVFTWSSLAFIVGTVGFGMVMGFVASCYKLRYAVLIHVFFNLVICIFAAYNQFRDDVHENVSFSDSFIRFESHRHRQAVPFDYSYSDTLVHYNATLGGMVEHMMGEYHKNLGFVPDELHVVYQYDYNPINPKCYDISIRSVSKVLSPADYREIVKVLNNHGLFNMDTTYQNRWLLDISVPSKACGQDDDGYQVKQLIVDLRFKYRIPVFVEAGTNKAFPLLNIISQKVRKANTLEDCIEMMNHYGINLYEDSLSKVQVINIKDMNSQHPSLTRPQDPRHRKT